MPLLVLLRAVRYSRAQHASGLRRAPRPSGDLYDTPASLHLLASFPPGMICCCALSLVKQKQRLRITVEDRLDS